LIFETSVNVSKIIFLSVPIGVITKG